MTPEKQAIGFESFVGKTTRAEDATKSNLRNLYVYGYIGDATPVKIFDGTLVSRADASQPWSYSPVQYWTAGKNYFFTAVSSQVSLPNRQYNYTWADELPADINGFNGVGTISFDNAAAVGNEDLLYASATKNTLSPLTTDPGEVEFAFQHALSRVKFTFKNAMGSDAYSIKVYDLTINNATGQAELPLGAAEPEWVNHENTTVLTLRPEFFSPQTAGNGADVISGTKFIIPGTSSLEITFKIDLILNGTVTQATYNHIAKVLPEVNFVNGHSYNFVAEVNAENIDPENEIFPIKFNVVDVAEWVEEAGTEVEL